MNRNIIFWGTPDFAEIILSKLFEGKFQVVAVVTQPDKPKGRHKEPRPSPVKTLAIKHNVLVLQPSDIKNPAFISGLRDFRPGLMIVAAFGKIIPASILNLADKGAINAHPSLLPKYRGASPVTGALIAGDKETGVTLILMDKKMDHGPILGQEKIPIAPDDTNISLHQKLASKAAEMLIKTIPNYLADNIKTKSQDESRATFTKILTKEDGHIDWQRPAVEIERQIRAYVPWPMSWTVIKKCPRPELEGKKIIILQANISSTGQGHLPGRLNLSKGQLTISTSLGDLTIAQLQVEGGRSMTAKEFLAGYGRLDSTILG